MLKHDKFESPNNLSLPVPSNYDVNCDFSFESASTTYTDTTPHEDTSSI